MSNINVDYDVLNQRGSPAWFTDTFANIPTAGFVGRMFISKDTFAFYRDTGTGWDLIGGPGIGTLTGSGVAGQVSFFNGTQVLAGNNNLFWDNINSRLGINTTTPGVALDIHSTANSLIQLNNTTTANSVIAFKNQNVTKWRIGNEYGSGANIFTIFNFSTTSTPFQISNTTNQITINGAIDTGANAITTGLLLSNSTLSVLNNGSVTGTNGVSSFGGNVANNGFTFAPNNSSYHRFIVPISANYEYTFPATTGTIALISNLTTGYVPYTGANANVNLGANNLTATNVFGETSLNVKVIASGSVYSTGYSTLSSLAGTFTMAQEATAGNLKAFTFDFSAWASTSSYTYTLPAASGTIALTSNLSSYVPYTGATANVYLGANSLFAYDLFANGNGTNNANLYLKQGTQSLLIQNGYSNILATGTKIGFQVATSSVAAYYAEFQFSSLTAQRTYTLPNATGTIALTSDLSSYLPLTGGTLTGALSGTSATFSNTVISTGGSGFQSLVEGGFVLRNTANNANLGGFTRRSYWAGGSALDTQIFSETGYGIFLNVNGSTTSGMTITSAGNVGINTTSSIIKLYTQSDTTTTASYALGASNGTSNLFLVRGNGQIITGDAAASPYNNTIANVANLFVAIDGTLSRSTASSIRFKDNIMEWNENGLNTILALKPKTFTYKKSYYSQPNRKFLGLIAEDVAEVCLYLADFENEDGTGQVENVRYATIVVPLIKAIQELNEKLVRNNIN